MKNAAIVCTVIFGLLLVYGLATDQKRAMKRVIGLTAVCGDGMLTTAPRAQGVCAGHGGVKEWVK